jgi:tetratricopeptide (TPR) repeat protein
MLLDDRLNGYRVFSAHAQSSNPQQTLNQYVADLQKNPNDYALREKIIRHVQTMKPTPAVPDEARRFMNRGMAAAEGAKTESDYRDAIQEFQKAVNIAPWLGSGYRNLSVVQDKAGQYAQAVQNLKLFLLTNPPAADAEAAKTLMDKIEYRQEKAAKESSPQAIAAKKQKEYEDWLRKIDGRRYTYRNTLERTTTVLDVKGSVLIQGAIVDPDSPVLGRRGYIEYERYEIRDRVAAGPVMNVPGDPYGSLQFIYAISESGDRITEQTRRGNGQTGERIFLWQR